MSEGRQGRSETACWIDREIAACEFSDARLGKRFRNLLEQIGDAVGASIPIEVDPGFGTGGLVGKMAVPLLNGADDDEENETDD